MGGFNTLPYSYFIYILFIWIEKNIKCFKYNSIQKGMVTMNTTAIENNKIFVIREYNNFEDDELSSRTDILEYLYDIRDSITEKIDILTSRANKILNGVRNTRLSMTHHDSRIDDTETHGIIRISAKTAKDLLTVINDMIEEVLCSDDAMFAVVWDCTVYGQRNPRLRAVKKTYIPVYPLKFDKKKLFHLGDVYNANALSVTDESDEIKIMNDFHMTTQFHQGIIGIDMFGVFDSLRLTEEVIATRIKGVYVEESDVDNAIASIKNVNDQLNYCKDCGCYWILTDRNRQFFIDKGLKLPKRCASCRNARKIKMYEN